MFGWDRNGVGKLLGVAPETRLSQMYMIVRGEVVRCTVGHSTGGGAIVGHDIRLSQRFSQPDRPVDLIGDDLEGHSAVPALAFKDAVQDVHLKN